MHFTREPIIETVITPRDGYKLAIRSTKTSNVEEYQVDAVEVVSFGHSFFFRSLEKPTSFLVPVTDYEVVEQRETRIALKNAPAERSIKIAGGREAPIRTHREERPVEERPADENEPHSDQPQSSNGDLRHDRKRRRRGRRGGRDRDRGPHQDAHHQPNHDTPPESTSSEGPIDDELPVTAEEAKAPSFMSKLFPPPPNLIKETLGRYQKPSDNPPHDNSKTLDDPFFDGHRPSDSDDPPQETHFED